MSRYWTTVDLDSGFDDPGILITHFRSLGVGEIFDDGVNPLIHSYYIWSEINQTLTVRLIDLDIHLSIHAHGELGVGRIRESVPSVEEMRVMVNGILLQEPLAKPARS